MQAVEEFLSELAINREWKVLGFYAMLIEYAHKTEYLCLNGTGTSGFSIRVDIKGKGEISLCTLYRNKLIDFSLKRVFNTLKHKISVVNFCKIFIPFLDIEIDIRRESS